jgi:threonine dehydrogenase-like Zn-dependent dehydrogenase
MIQAAEVFRPETLVAVDAVGRALELARRRAGAEHITFKGARDVVTETDVAVENAVST